MVAFGTFLRPFSIFWEPTLSNKSVKVLNHLCEGQVFTLTLDGLLIFNYVTPNFRFTGKSCCWCHFWIRARSCLSYCLIYLSRGSSCKLLSCVHLWAGSGHLQVLVKSNTTYLYLIEVLFKVFTPVWQCPSDIFYFLLLLLCYNFDRFWSWRRSYRLWWLWLNLSCDRSNYFRFCSTNN